VTGPYGRNLRGIASDATVTNFVTREDAEEFVAEEHRKSGIYEYWQEACDE
jgi:hypothetical protein